MPTETVRPDADVAVGGWTTAPLFSKVNDQSDGTTIALAGAAGVPSCHFAFPVPSEAYAAVVTGYNLRVRARRTAGTGHLHYTFGAGGRWINEKYAEITDSFAWYELEDVVTLTSDEIQGLKMDMGGWFDPSGDDAIAVSQVELVLTYDNTPPTTPGVFSAPLAGEMYRDELIVAWGPSTDWDDDSIQYEGEYSDDEGSSWSSLFSLQSGLSYTWDISGLTEGTQYQVRVRAHDGTDYSDAWRESNVFYISAPQPDAGTPDTSGGCTA